jgi:hypothetical protein
MGNNETFMWIRMWTYGVFFFVTLVFSFWPFAVLEPAWAFLVFFFVSFPAWCLITNFAERKLLK